MKRKKISNDEFQLFRELIQQELGISLSDAKRYLLEARLQHWIVQDGYENYHELYQKIVQDSSGKLLHHLTNAITTNVTSFFREPNQWEFLRREFFSIIDKKKKKLRVWSAACSSGEEPYSVLLFLYDFLPDFEKWNIQILATDISSSMLQKASIGRYPNKEVEALPRHLRLGCFTHKKGDLYHTIKPIFREKVLFRHFNLSSGKFSILRNKFDFVFCRNVTIYFDKKTQENVLKNISTTLHPKGHLFLGHSESIFSDHLPYSMVIPTVYNLNKRATI